MVAQELQLFTAAATTWPTPAAGCGGSGTAAHAATCRAAPPRPHPRRRLDRRAPGLLDAQRPARHQQGPDRSHQRAHQEGEARRTRPSELRQLPPEAAACRGSFPARRALAGCVCHLDPRPLTKLGDVEPAIRSRRHRKGIRARRGNSSDGQQVLYRWLVGSERIARRHGKRHATSPIQRRDPSRASWPFRSSYSGIVRARSCQNAGPWCGSRR
jgi:hypothetical protein